MASFFIGSAIIVEISHYTPRPIRQFLQASLSSSIGLSALHELCRRGSLADVLRRNEMSIGFSDSQTCSETEAPSERRWQTPDISQPSRGIGHKTPSVAHFFSAPSRQHQRRPAAWQTTARG